MNHITAKELRAILAAVPDDDGIYIPDQNGDGNVVRSYTFYRYDDGRVELTLFSDEMCGLGI